MDINKPAEGNIVPVDRPDWDTYFMMLAEQVSLRSMDAQTKVGSLLVNDKKFILGTGYNSFPPGVDDKNIPNTRPAKYARVLHSELNSVINSYANLHQENNITLYSTLRPCVQCLMVLMRYDVTRIVYLDKALSAKVGEDQEWFDTLITSKGISLEKFPPRKLTGV